MDNDANVQALGEWRYGAGRGFDEMLFVNVGTGIGGGVITGGKLHRGRHGLAGEVGHTVVQPDGPVCTCGKRGCVEIMAAGPAIGRTGREALAAHPERGAILRRLAGGELGRVTSELVFRAAEEGDGLALEVLASACRYLGIGIANAAAIVDPEIVVVDGGVAKAGDLFFRPLQEAARNHDAPLDPDMLNIVPGTLGDDANILGAVALAEQELRLCPPARSGS
jgi:glucokinase